MCSANRLTSCYINDDPGESVLHALRLRGSRWIDLPDEFTTCPTSVGSSTQDALGGLAMKTERTRRLPLFFTHPIGSLPRPQMVRDLLARREELSADRFGGLLDDCVRFAIHLQELAGLDVVSDGEWRRVQYIREFLLRIGGFE